MKSSFPYILCFMLGALFLISNAPFSKSYIAENVEDLMYRYDSTIVVICGEENATDLDTGYVFSFGNGSSAGGNRGIVLPDSARLLQLAVGSQTSISGTATVQLHADRTSRTGAEISWTSTGSSKATIGSSVFFTQDEIINFKCTSKPTSGGQGTVICAWLKFRTSEL